MDHANYRSPKYYKGKIVEGECAGARRAIEFKEFRLTGGAKSISNNDQSNYC